MKKRIVTLASGQGSNLQAVIDACANGKISAEISAVLSNNAEAYALTRAKQAGISAHFIKPSHFIDRATFDAELITLIEPYQPDLIILAGYMRILSANFVQHFAGRLINIHPSLLPKYPGLHTHQKVLLNGDKEHGASVHFVTEELDGGPVILQTKIPVFSGENEDDLKARVQTEEHIIYPLVVKWFCEGRLSLHDNSAWLDGKRLPEQGYTED